MKIALIDADSHNWPNLCLMKISAYHKARDDTVEWWDGFSHYDLAYKSRVFDDTYSPDDQTVIQADRIIQGGTGYGIDNRLPDEIEYQYPDYALYPQFADTAYGFLTRGCPRTCPFCIVSRKEGTRSHPVSDLSAFWRGQRCIKLLDANLLASPDHEALLSQLADSRASIDFTQGLDIRLTTPDNVRLLNRISTDMLRFAWDNPREDLTEHFIRFDSLSKIKGSRRRGVYVLVNFNSSHEEDLYRITTLRALHFSPYVMVYDRSTAPPITLALQRWVNNKRIFGSVPEFEDYAPGRRKNERDNKPDCRLSGGDDAE